VPIRERPRRRCGRRTHGRPGSLVYVESLQTLEPWPEAFQVCKKKDILKRHASQTAASVIHSGMNLLLVSSTVANIDRPTRRYVPLEKAKEACLSEILAGKVAQLLRVDGGPLRGCAPRRSRVHY
jgi:hypothetical protein